MGEDYSKSKFADAVAEYLYVAALEGLGDEITIGDETWTAIHFDEDLAVEVNDRLVGDNRGRSCWFHHNDGLLVDVTTGYHGAIIYEDPQGNVKVQILAETSMEMDDAWDEITHIHAEYEQAIA